ncbi:MAG: hypothetical protein ACOC3X_00465 [Nanoarchaeota archaeon]
MNNNYNNKYIKILLVILILFIFISSAKSDMDSGLYSMIIHDDDGEPITYFYKNGSLATKGEIYENEASCPTSEIFKIKNDADTVVASIDNEGNLYLMGDIQQDPEEKIFNIKNDDDVITLSIDENGILRKSSESEVHDYDASCEISATNSSSEWFQEPRTAKVLRIHDDTDLEHNIIRYHWNLTNELNEDCTDGGTEISSENAIIDVPNSTPPGTRLYLCSNNSLGFCEENVATWNGVYRYAENITFNLEGNIYEEDEEGVIQDAEDVEIIVYDINGNELFSQADSGPPYEIENIQHMKEHPFRIIFKKPGFIPYILNLNIPYEDGETLNNDIILQRLSRCNPSCTAFTDGVEYCNPGCEGVNECEEVHENCEFMPKDFIKPINETHEVDCSIDCNGVRKKVASISINDIDYNEDLKNIESFNIRNIKKSGDMFKIHAIVWD